MNVTPKSKKLGRYRPGDVFSISDRKGRALIKAGIVIEVFAEPFDVVPELPDAAESESDQATPDVAPVVDEPQPDVADVPAADESLATDVPTDEPSNTAPETAQMATTARKAVTKKAAKKAAPKKSSPRQYQTRDLRAPT